VIFGERIEQAREFRQLTQSELAARLGIEHKNFSRIERGSETYDGLAAALADVLAFPVGFFEKEPLRDFALGTLDFRARTTTSAKAKKRAYQYARLVFELAAFMSSRLKAPPPRLPRLTGDPEEAATNLRSDLGMNPDSPILNLTDSLERAGVFVFALPDLEAGCDGFSAWGVINRRITPAIFVSAAVSGDRARLTVAHEVGELTLLEKPPGNDREKAANRFAGALLMPAEAFRKHLVAPVSLYDLMDIKRFYGVSIQAALVRAFHLGIITDRRYRTLYRQLSSERWRKNEPIKIAFEKPRGLSKMAELLYGLPVDVVRMAADGGLPPIMARQLLSAHATKADLRGLTNARIADVIPFRKDNQKDALGDGDVHRVEA